MNPNTAFSAPQIEHSPRIEPVSVELPPDLPMPAFTSNECFDAARVGALAVYCSDGRYGNAFDDFCQRKLDIPRYDRFAVPGGPAWIAQGAQRPDLLAAAREQMEFLVTAHDLNRIVLITHWACAFYARGKDASRTPRQRLPQQLRDVEAATRTLKEWFPKVAVDNYLAMQNVGAVSFYDLSKTSQAPATTARPLHPPSPPALQRGATAVAAARASGLAASVARLSRP